MDNNTNENVQQQEETQEAIGEVMAGLPETEIDISDIQLETAWSGAFPTIISNTAEVKEKLEMAVRKYDTMEVTEDTLTKAKKDLADLRKKQADAKKRYKSMKDQAMVPVDTFKAVFDDMMSVVDQRINDLAAKVADIDSKRHDSRRQEVQDIVDERMGMQDPEIQKFTACPWFWLASWDNLTYSDAKVNKDIERQVADIKTALYIIGKSKHAAALLNQYNECGSLSNIQQMEAELDRQDEEAERIRKYQEEQREAARQKAQENATANAMLQRSAQYTQAVVTPEEAPEPAPAPVAAPTPEPQQEEPQQAKEELNCIRIVEPPRGANPSAHKILRYTMRVTAPAYVLASIKKGLEARGCTVERIGDIETVNRTENK